MKPQTLAQGAEAVIILDNQGKIIKHRIKKSYRIPKLDDQIRRSRTKSESKLIVKAGEIINTPKILETLQNEKVIEMEFIKGKKLSIHLDKFPLAKQKQILKQIGKDTAKLHAQNIIHGDLTTSNMILVQPPTNAPRSKNSPYTLTKSPAKRLDKVSREATNRASAPIIFFIDFGLGYFNGKYEDKAVDIHLLKQALEAKHFKNRETLFAEFQKGYISINKPESKKVLERLKAVERRGRYKH